MSGPKRTYYIPANFDIPFPGPLRLGMLIADINDPRYALDPQGPISLEKHDIKTWSNSQGVAEHDFGSESTIEAGLFLKACEHVAARLGLKLEKHESESVLANIETLDVKFIAPNDAYVSESMKTTPVQEWLKARWFKKRVYMITGLKIARPSGNANNKIMQNSESSSEISDEVEGSGTAAAIPAAAGVKGREDHRQHNRFSFIPLQPFIYGFELRSCRYGARSRKLRTKAKTKGALLEKESDSTKDGPTDPEIDQQDDLEFIFHHVADEDLDPGELGTEGRNLEVVTSVDEMDGHECKCVVIKA